VKVGDLEELGLALLHPGKGLTALALGAVTVATANGELTISCLMGKLGNGESKGSCRLHGKFFHVFHQGYVCVLLPISQPLTGGRPTVIWSPIAKTQGAQCWSDILRH